ncbi:RpiB/LacA/LacB family sugar-phosphate isomerase [bacterium]|nr:RpiB/LacA/LacB family sugar-phosphate isomerase [bacterium]
MAKLLIGSDHGGFDLKEFLKSYLKDEGYEVDDIGTNSKEACDYPDVANKMADYLSKDSENLGILICGTGLGMSMAINRYRNIRGALLYSPEEARLAREHNNANVAVLGARTFSNKENLDFLTAFLTAKFSNEERHKRRIDKIS